VVLNRYYYQIKSNELGGKRCTHLREGRSIQVFGGQTEGMRPLGKPRRWWKNYNNGSSRNAFDGMF
jgi:hypothetical protein